MSNVEKMSIALTPAMAANIKEVVQSGEFASTSEVIRSALREWQESRAQKAAIIEKIGALWDEGINSGMSIDSQIVFDELDELIDGFDKSEKAA